MNATLHPETTTENSARVFDWPLAYEAERVVGGHVSAFLEKNAFARRLAERMRDETGTDFFEWVDHLVVAPGCVAELRAAGFVGEDVEAAAGTTVLWHPQAMMPRVLVRAGEGGGAAPSP